VTADAEHAPPVPPFPAMRSWLALTGLMAVAVCVSVVMLGGLGPGDWLAPAVSSGVACWVAAMVALEPIRRASRLDAQRVALAALAAMGIRLALSALGVVAVAIPLGLPSRVTALWALGWYLLLLVAEVTILVRYFRTLPGPMPAPGAAETSKNDSPKE
jgi:hypothetical protein